MDRRKFLKVLTIAPFLGIPFIKDLLIGTSAPTEPTNPATQLADLMTNKVYGLGIPKSEIDWEYVNYYKEYLEFTVPESGEYWICLTPPREIEYVTIYPQDNFYCIADQLSATGFILKAYNMKGKPIGGKVRCYITGREGG